MDAGSEQQRCQTLDIILAQKRNAAKNSSLNAAIELVEYLRRHRLLLACGLVPELRLSPLLKAHVKT